MAKSFNLTAELNLRGPSNIKNVVSQIRKQLGTISADVSLKIDPKASKNIDIISKKLQVMNTALVQARANSNNLNSSLRDLAISMETIKNTGTTSASSIQKTASSLKNTTKATKEATDSIQEFGKQSALAVRRFAAFSIVTSGIYGLINAITSGTKAFIDFDRQIVKLQQVTGKSKSELSGISDEITKLATNLGVSSSSLIEVASTLAQAGISAKDTKIALEALAKTELAPSFDNLKETTEGAIAAIRQFGLETSELESALGSINAVAAAFAVESSDIIAAIQRTGGVFASASKGVSEGTDALNEFIAVFTSVRATTRESAETIATGLRTIFTRIQRGKTIEQLKQFGVELQDLEGKFVGPFEAVKRLSEALNQLDPRDIRFSSIVEELGGFRQIGKVIPLIQQFATAQEALKVAQRGQDSLTNAQITAQQSLANQLAKVREQFLALVREVGQSSAFQKLFKIITGLSGGFISLLGAFKPILPLLGLLAAVKGLGAITKFGSGLFQGLGKGGAAQSGQNIGESISGSKEKEKAETIAKAAEATKNNTNALVSLTSAIQSLENKITSMGGPATISGGGRVLGFNKGGVVPGSGRGDKVPALLEPGEVVMNNNAVNKYGRGNLVRMNKYVGGGKVNITAQELKGRSRSSKAVENLITDDKDTALYGSGRAINTLDNISFNRRIYKLYDEDSVNDWKGFEEAVQKRVGGTRTNIGKNDPSFPIDIIGSNLGPLEVRNRSESTSNRTLLDKLIRYYISKPDFSKLQNRPTPDDISLGNIGVVYNSAKYDPPNAKELMTGGKIQNFMAGSPGGISVASGKGRGVKGPKGARSYIEPISSETYLKWAKGIYDEYDADPSLVMAAGPEGSRRPPEIALADMLLSQYALETGGAGLSIGQKFVRTPSANITDELRPYLVPDPSDPNELGFFKDDVVKFGKLKKIPQQVSSEISQRKTTSKMQRGLFGFALEGVAKSVRDKTLTKEQLETLSPDVLEALSKDPQSQVFSLPKLKPEVASGSSTLLDTLKGPLSEFRKSGGQTSLAGAIPETAAKQIEAALPSYIDSVSDDPQKVSKAKTTQKYFRSFIGGGTAEKPGHATAFAETINQMLKSGTIQGLADGGMIQKFMPGSVGGRGVQSSSEKIDQAILDRINSLGGKGGIVDLVPSAVQDAVKKTGISANQLLKTQTLRAMPNGAAFAPALKTLLGIAEEAKKLKDEQTKKQQELNSQAAAGKGLKFGLASLYGPNNELGYSNVTQAKQLLGKDGTTKYLTQIVRKSLPNRYSDAVSKIQQDIAGLPARGAEQFQYTDIFGTGGPLAFDFDDTLVKGADIFAANGGIDIQGYNDLERVREALTDSKLTLLGKELAKRLIDYPELMDNVRVLTARPQSNAPLLASKLASLGLPIPLDKITGVAGGLNKVDNLSELETLIDDNLGNIQSVTSGGKSGYLYREPQAMSTANKSSQRATASMEGYGLEEIVKQLGVGISSDDANPLRPIDYPDGLGSSANIWGFDPNMPTDTKRTNDSSAVSRLWAETQKYITQNFAFGGKADGPGFEEIRQQIIDKYPEIDFGIRKRKKSSGFGYNLTGALKATGGLSGKDSVNFQQPTNLKQLQEYADKLASKLMNPEEFAIGGLIKRFASGGTVPAMVSNGEAFVPPNIAKKIGYSKLDKMNQADRNGMKSFATGGISTFKGAGNGTSDSIGPIGLPTGSYVIREKATKALGLNKGGGVGIRKFVAGSPGGVSSAGGGLAFPGYDIKPLGMLERAIIQLTNSFSTNAQLATKVGEQFSALSSVAPELATYIDRYISTLGLSDKQALQLISGYGKLAHALAEEGLTTKEVDMMSWRYMNALDAATKAHLISASGAGTGATPTVPNPTTSSQTQSDTQAAESSVRLSKDERKKRKEQFLADQRGGVTRLEARSVGMPRPDFGAGASRRRDVMATPQGEMNVKNIEAEVLNNTKRLYAEQKKKIDELYDNLESQAREEFFSGTIDADELTDSLMALFQARILAKGQAKQTLTAQNQTEAAKAVEEYKTGKQAPAIEQRRSADADAFSTEVQSSMDQVVKEAKAKYEALYSEEKQSLKDYYQAKAKNVADEGGDVAAVIDEYKAAIGELKQSIKSGFGTEVKEKQAQVPEQIAEQKKVQVESLRDSSAVDSTYLQAQEAKAKADLIAAEQAEFFAFKAKQAGLTTEQYQRKLAAETVKLAKDLATDLKAKQIDLKQSTINVGAGLKGRARDGSDEDKSFIKKAENTIIEKLQAINPTAQLKDLEVTAGKLVDQMISADVSFEDLTQNNTDLAEALNKTYTEAEATAEAMKAMSDKTGMAVEILENQIGDMVDSRRTTMGAFKANAADVVDSLGGPVRVLGIGMTIVADQVGQLITSLDSNSKQNVGLMTALGAFTGAAQGMVAGQVIGAEGGKLLEKFFPDLPGLGKKFEIVSTAVGTAIGLIKGAADAYYRSKLDTVLANIAKSGSEVDLAFEKLAKNNTPQNFEAAQKALKDSSQNIMDLADQGNIGAGGSSRTALEWMRGLDFTGITSSVTGQATEKESRERFVGEVGSQVDRASQLGQVRIQQVSGKEIQASVKQIQEFDKQIGELKKTGGAGAEAAIKDVQAAKQEFLGTRSQVFGQLRQIYATDKDAFLALYIEQAKRSGLTAEQISDAIKTPEGLDAAIKKGEEISSMYAEQEQRARLLADASRKVVIATQNILNVYRLLEANLTRFGGEITNIVSDVNQLTSAYEGSATIQAPRRTDEQIFSNISAYNEEEVAGAASRAGALAGGGQRGADLERRIIGAKTIKDELPKILQGITSSDADEAMAQIADKFKSMGIELDPAVFDQLAKTLQSKLLGQGEGATAAELAEDPALLESLSKISEETLRSAGMMAKAFNDAMSSTVDLINKYGQSIEQATEWQLKAANIRLNAENQLAQTLGQNLTLEQLNAPQESRIRGLTASNVLPGGSMDPNQIFRSMQTMIEDTPNQEKELEKRQLEFANAASDTERDRAKKAVDDQIKYMANQNAAINNSQKALEELANGSEAASNALNKLGEQQKLAQGSVNMMQKVLTSTPTELNDINKQIGAYTKMISGRATDRDIGSLDFRQAAFGGLNMMQSLMPENVQRQMQAKMTREMLSRTPEGQELLETKTGALGPDGKPMTMGQALNLTETGRDPIQEQYLNEYAAATQRQADAADRLGDSAIRVGEITVAGVDRILTKLSEELPKQYGKAVEKSTPEPSEEKDATPEPTDPLVVDFTGTNSLIATLTTQSGESANLIVASINRWGIVIATALATLKLTGGMNMLKNMTGRIPGMGGAKSAGSMPGGTMGAQVAKTAAASAGRATTTGAASASRAAAGGIGSTALNAVKTGANSVGVAVNSAGKALAGFSSSFAGQMVAFNTGMSAINNAMAFASDPTAYVAGLQEKSDAELRMVQEGQTGVAMLQGAMEGLQDPIGKIAEGVVTLKGLADDFVDAAARGAKNKRIEEQGKERRVKERGGKDKNQELSRLSTQEANKAMSEAQTTVELKALKDIQARGGSVEDFAKLTGSSTNAFIDPNTGKQMDINELIKQRETALSTYDGKKSEDYKVVVDKEIKYREQQLEQESKKQNVVVENTALVTPPPPPSKPAEVQAQTKPTAVTQQQVMVKPSYQTQQNTQTSERFIPPPSRPVVRAEATAPLQQTKRKPNATTIAIKKQEAFETQASVDQLELVKLAKEAEIAKKAKKLKTTRIAAVGAGTLKTSEKVATAQSSVDMAQQDLAGINKQITAEKQRLAAIAEQIRLEKQGETTGRASSTSTGVVSGHRPQDRTGQPVSRSTVAQPNLPGETNQEAAARHNAAASRGEFTAREPLPTRERYATAPIPSQNDNRQTQGTQSIRSPGETTGYSLSIDEKTTQFLSSLQTTFNSFGDYITRLEKASSNIPDKIDLVLKTEPIEVKITGGAVIEALQSVPEFIQDMINKSIKEKTKSLTDMWNTTGGALGSNPRS